MPPGRWLDSKLFDYVAVVNPLGDSEYHALLRPTYSQVGFSQDASFLLVGFFLDRPPHKLVVPYLRNPLRFGIYPLDVYS